MRIGLLAALLTTCVTLAVACGESNNGAESSLVSEGSLAPDFTLPDANGGSVTLSDVITEKSVLLYFSMGSG